MHSFDRDGFYREIGLRIQLARKRLDRTQEEVAAELDMPRASLANIELGRQRVNVDVLWRLAVVLEVRIDRLVPEPLKSATMDATFREQLSATISTRAAPEHLALKSES